MSSLGVVLDANVLFPISLCDTLLRAAAAGLYRLHWTDDILEEVHRNLAMKRISEEQAQRRMDEMKKHFPEALVTDHQALIGMMTNDPKDRHVLAAAVASGSQVIVTSNLQDFPLQALTPFHIEAQSPDLFLVRLFESDPESMQRIVLEQAAELRHPPKTSLELLDVLNQHVPEFVTRVRQELETTA